MGSRGIIGCGVLRLIPLCHGLCRRTRGMVGALSDRMLMTMTMMTMMLPGLDKQTDARHLHRSCQAHLPCATLRVTFTGVVVSRSFPSSFSHRSSSVPAPSPLQVVRSCATFAAAVMSPSHPSSFSFSFSSSTASRARHGHIHRAIKLEKVQSWCKPCTRAGGMVPCIRNPSHTVQ